MSATSAASRRQAAAAANQDFMAYQQSVVAQNNAATSADRASTAEASGAEVRGQGRAAAAERNRSLAAADAGRRHAAAGDQNPSLEPRARRSDAQTARRRSSAPINSKEAAAIDAQRRADAATLSAYRAQLDAQTGAAVRAQAGAIAGQTQAKLEERRNEVGAQLRSLGPPALPANLPPGVQQKIAAIHQQFTAQFQADAQKTIADYQATKTDLDRQFAGLARRRRGSDRSGG